MQESRPIILFYFFIGIEIPQLILLNLLIGGKFDTVIALKINIDYPKERENKTLVLPIILLY